MNKQWLEAYLGKTDIVEYGQGEKDNGSLLKRQHGTNIYLNKPVNTKCVPLCFCLEFKDVFFSKVSVF